MEREQVPHLPGPQSDPRRDGDAALLADLTSPPPLEQAQESFDYWCERAAELPIHKRAERKEAQAMPQKWKERLAQAERARYCPSPLEQLLTALGVRGPPHRPSRRKIIAGLSIAALVLLTILILLIVAVIVFWPHIVPIIRALGAGNGGGG